MGLAPPPRKKKKIATETPTKDTETTVLEEEGSSFRRLMTPCGESRESSEATGSSTLLSSRNITIGSWNVRTLYQTGKTAQVAAEMRNYNLALLGVSETRWTQTGQRRLLSGEMLLFSGHEEDNAPHTEGVALMLSRSAQSALIGWEAHGPRIITASFRTKKKKIKMNAIQCYAPTNDSDEENKDQFYNRLQTIIDKCPVKDVNILMGYFNAKIGKDNTGYEEVMGKHGLGEINENGERFADTCALNKIVIGGSIFPHKRIHKATWVSPDHVTENQIDHICIGKTFRRSLQDVRVKRGADAASVDFSGNFAQGPDAEGEENSSKQQPHKNSKGKSARRICRSQQRSKEEHKGGQEKLHRQPGRGSGTGSRKRKHERALRHYQETVRQVLPPRATSEGQRGKCYHRK